MNGNTTTTTNNNTTTNTNNNTNGGITMNGKRTLVEIIIDAQNGYVRDRKHEKVAVWEVKESIISTFAEDNHVAIAYAVGNWMICAGYNIMNRKDSELYAIADRVVAFCVNGVHITTKNKNGNARADVFSSGRVKAALYRAMECDFTLNVRKDEEKPTVKAPAYKKNTKKEDRIVRIMNQFNCTRELAEKMAV